MSHPLKLAFATLFTFAAAFSPAHAGGIDEARLGAMAQGIGGWAPDKEQGIGVNLELLFKSPEFLKGIGAPRPLIGAMIATDSDATSAVYLGFEWKQYFGSKAFIAGTLGGAVHNGETDTFDPIADMNRFGNTQFLGCRALFLLGADIGVDLTDKISASVHVQHMSNAGLCDDNEGLDHLGVRVGYRF